MRKSSLTSLALGCGALLSLVSLDASALPIHVGLVDASGSHSWTSPVIGDPHGTVTLTAWEYDNNAWTDAVTSYKSGSAAETGMGVTCNQEPAGNECGEDEIGATPWQMLDLDISQLTGWSGLTLYLGSVNAAGTGGDETGYLLGATCTVGGSCTPIVLGSCTDFGNWPGHSAQCMFNFTEADLLGQNITDIWVASSITDQSGTSNSNILLGSDFVLNTVPEPKALGIFGLGLLLIGVFVGLRRRRRQTG
jgi:hypothetical protein